jgi:ribosomal protein L29
MKSKDLKNKDITTLEKELFEKRSALSNIHSNVSGSKARNVKEVSTTRKAIARILTEINARK